MDIQKISEHAETISKIRNLCDGCIRRLLIVMENQMKYLELRHL